MSDRSTSDSDSEYAPHSESDDDSCDSDLECDSDEYYDDSDPEPLEEDGWKFMSDPFSDARPDIVPTFAGVSAQDSDNPALHSVLSVPTPFVEPKDAFLYIFDYEVIDNLCRWMNERASIFIEETGKRKINCVVWTPVTRAEMYVFLCLLMAMGLTPMPRIYMYWARRFSYGGPKCFSSDIMGRSRFLSLLKFLRFSPASNVRKSSPRTRSHCLSYCVNDPSL